MIEDLKIRAEEFIIFRIEEIKAAYFVGKNQANYDHKIAGLNKAYEKLNELLPKDFRKGLNFADASLLNTEIRRLLVNRPELY